MSTNLLHGDCLELMGQIPDGSVDMVLADPPYGTTACKWDSIIPLKPMWKHLKRVIKPNGAIVMTASQPFTTTLIASNMAMFKYSWVWLKNRYTGFLQSKSRPMRAHEDIVVFVDGVPTYNPQKTTGHIPTNSARGYGHSPTFGKCKPRNYKGGDTTRFPKSLLRFDCERGLHPTQKPVPLMEYLIRTYTNEGEMVLDFAFGSLTTGVACKRTNRDFIGIELNETYFAIGKKRIEEEQPLFKGDTND